MANTASYPLALKINLVPSFEGLFEYGKGLYLDLKVTVTIFMLAQRAKKKVNALFAQIIIHLARILGKTVAGKPPDHQDEPDRNRPHWWKEIKNFLKQIRAEGLSEAQLRKILEDAFSTEEVEAVMKALRQAAEMMGESEPTLFE